MSYNSIENVLQAVPETVWAVTAATRERRGGLLATWVHRVSLDPLSPVMLVGLAPNHFTRELVDESGAFVLHLFEMGRATDIARFAIGSGRARDKLAEWETSPGETGAPILRGCLGWLECRVLNRYDAGDRVFYWADVLAGRVESSDAPLTAAQLMAALGPEARAQIEADRETDIRLQRPLRDAWRRSLPARDGSSKTMADKTRQNML